MAKRTGKTRKPLRKAKRRVLTAYDRLKPWIGRIHSSKHPDAPFTSDDSSKQVQEIIYQKWKKRGL